MSKVGDLLIEGKTKQVRDLPGEPHNCLMISKDSITANNAAKQDELRGKGEVSTTTNCLVFEYLKRAGVPTAFVRRGDEPGQFVARKCTMIPIEWVTRRLATGSFLRRNPGVEEGYRFTPPKLETFFKDDDNDDPQWSREQVETLQVSLGNDNAVTIGKNRYDKMAKLTVLVFELLERAWISMDCVLVDMKVEYGLDPETGDVLLADVIDSDSWRLWPQGDKRLMKDKQVYRDMVQVTEEGLQSVLKNFQWVSDKLEKGLSPKVGSRGRVALIMGSGKDATFCKTIATQVNSISGGLVTCESRVCSAHKQPDAVANLVATLESNAAAVADPLVIIAVAGRSNGLGPVCSGVATCPVINCPPLSSQWAQEDIWSSLRVPSGIGCTTVLDAETAALAALQMIGQTNHHLWGRLRARQVLTWIHLREEDAEMNK